jgi:hypothetical protein
MMSLHFDDIIPGTIIRLTMMNGDIEEVQIGATGSYYLDNIDLSIRAVTFVPRY